MSTPSHEPDATGPASASGPAPTRAAGRGTEDRGTEDRGSEDRGTGGRGPKASRGRTRRAVSDRPQNMGMFRLAVALYGLAVMAYGIWLVFAGTAALPDHGHGVTTTVESSSAGLAAVLVGVGASLVAIAVKFQWVNLLGFMCGALFLGGVGHILAWAFRGLPHWSMILLMVLDLVLPPVLMVWYGWIRKANGIRREMAAQANATRGTGPTGF